METITIDNDIKVLCVTATSFPDGIMDAYKKLNELIPFSAGRRYFGLSRPENGTIVYKAAIETPDDAEAEKLHCETLVIKKGTYISQTIIDFMSDLPAIGKTFEKLLTDSRIDPQGYCVEWYLNDKDVRCMVRLSD